VSAVHIDIIETLPSLARLEDAWYAVYDADDEAQIFLSWKRLSGWLSSIPGPWFILAAKERDAADLPYIAFFPVRLQTTIEKSDVFGNVRMAGNFGADYTGIVCRPKASFHSTKVDKIIKTDGIDNSLCPYATLPNDWNAYLDALSTNTRQKIRRLLKQIEASSEYRITVATSETFERDLKTLLGFWDKKWRARKADRTDSLIRSNGAMLTRSFQSGLVCLPTFWPRSSRRAPHRSGSGAIGGPRRSGRP
jgi:hypothetical protein